ncbi:DUF2163 domain-containing protein [Pseudovibrio sp. Tun.PSC04-5.I4]|uniref:DUF2163 domain-containing protein n=1 Tax=Pseudovibrio sp. Tun.PSC04-5.I4 TaxID=1798213 RepID=UPI00088DB5EF|nr:DUF2163 domain-containing protein [Pseudovibrio sp. Tun.PSC04-5.I4]SDQ89099.1 phage conserved hypothetical protein BR0599 [Pseudovibrio sp. Tun.PSC04-5.I4]
MFNAALKEHLQGDGLTVAYCWQLKANNGHTLGFTNHDHAITFDGMTFEPGFGFDGTQANAQAEFQAGQEEALGILSSDSLSEQDLYAGLWDNAAVEVYLVNWQAPDQHQLLRRGDLGEVTRDTNVFRAEFRSLAARLSAPKGRVLSQQCHADLGDAKCGVDLSATKNTRSVTIARQDASKHLIIEANADITAGWWAFGKLTLLAGPYKDQALRIAGHTAEQGEHRLSLWSPILLELTFPLAAKISVGCDKSWGTCQSRFQNHQNFRGFPHMPGNDFMLAGPESTSAGNNGAKLVG